MTAVDLRPSEDQEPQSPQGGPPRALLIGGAIAIVLGALLAAAWLLGSLVGGEDAGSDIVAGQPVSVIIPDGSSARTIARILADAEVVASASSFEREVRDRDVAESLRAGSYELVTLMDTDALISELTTGPPAVETFSVTVIEGLRIEEMLDSLASQTPFTRVEFEAALGDVSSTFHNGGGDLAAWEGLLAPDTYEFTVEAAPLDMVQEMASTLERRVLARDWSATGLTPYEGLIVASLIEKEAKLDSERSVIASVIMNRLDIGMALQIDATIIYALGENPGRVLLSDLEIDSPYNTYKFTGLPPTPIGGVRSASLDGAAAPAETDFLFYVLNDPSGEHGFTADYDEFLRLKEQGRAAGALP
ncbi:MAG: endolytic transglycosylase MltG [Acidimicrobiia bacterium]|nr:endolytic transglycosylase MltG [Acidimicrobiia bacterium]